jgi:hypothetical protein
LIITENGKYSDPIRIRAHHLLCIQGFQGYGYSTDFVIHMGIVVSFLKSNPNTNLQIVDNTDELCSRCPHNVDGHCVKGSVDEIDSLIIESANLDIIHIYTVRDAFNIINKTLGHDHVVNICKDCNWKNKCLFFIEKTRI